LRPAQIDLFGEAQALPKAYIPDPCHVHNRLAEMLAIMRTSENWPWEADTVEFYRERVWPYLYEKLPDRDEAERWRGDRSGNYAARRRLEP
jgi:hypothetical protein